MKKSLWAKVKERFAKKHLTTKTKLKVSFFSSLALIILSILALNPITSNGIANATGTPRFNFLNGDDELLRAANQTKGQTEWSDPVSGQFAADNEDSVAFIFYFHNGVPNTTAHNVTLRAELPAEASNQVQVKSFLSSSETSPITDTVINGQIFGFGNGFAQVDLKDMGNLEYIPGSTKIWRNNPKQDGVTLPDGITSSQGLNIGSIDGCFQFAGFVTFRTKVKIKTPAELSINKTVAPDNSNNFVKSLEFVKSGDVVTWKIDVTNSGQREADGVLVKDYLPDHVSYINGSATLNGVKLPDTITGSGINIPEIGSGATATIKFKSKIGENLPFNSSGLFQATNIAAAIFAGKEIRSDAQVIGKSAPAMTIVKQVKISDNVWGEQNSVNLGDNIRYRIILTNTGNQTLTGVKVKDILPQFTEYIPGSTTENGNHIADGIADGGIIIGSLASKQSVVIEFSVITTGCPPIGDITVTNTARVISDQLSELFDTARTIIHLSPVSMPLVSSN